MASRIFLPEPSAASFRLGAVVKALAEARANVTVLTTKYEGARHLKEGITGTEGPLEKLSGKQGTGRSQIKRWPVLRDKTGYVRGYLPYLSFDVPLFFRILLEPKADILLVEPPPTTGAVVRVATALKRMPYVWYAADIWSDATEIAGAHPIVVRTVEAMERFTIRGADGVIAVSEGVGTRVRELGGTNVRVIPNGIDTDTYRPDVRPLSDKNLETLGINGRYLLYAGTASEWQGAKIFSAAMKRLAPKHRDLQLVYVGQGSEWDEIRDTGAQINNKFGRQVVVQLDPTSPETVAQLLAGASAALVSIVPDKGYDFAYPTKVLAALAAGAPVLFVGKGPVAKDLLSTGMGMVAPYEEEQIALQIEELLKARVSESLAAAATAEPSLAKSRHNWVAENRSMSAMGRMAAQFILSVTKRQK